jgi:hypothetical protein
LPDGKQMLLTRPGVQQPSSVRLRTPRHIQPIRRIEGWLGVVPSARYRHAWKVTGEAVNALVARRSTVQAFRCVQVGTHWLIDPAAR